MYPRLRDLRQDQDLTQKQLAALLKMSQTGYSKYETGENDVPTWVLIRLAELYRTSVDYLLGLTDQPRPYPRKGPARGPGEARRPQGPGQPGKRGKLRPPGGIAVFLTN